MSEIEANVQPSHPEVQGLASSLDGVGVSAEECLGQIAFRVAQIEQLRLEVNELVESARADGVTWASIGDAAGISASSAYQRWSERGRENHRLHQRRHTGKDTGQS